MEFIMFLSLDFSFKRRQCLLPYASILSDEPLQPMIFYSFFCTEVVLRQLRLICVLTFYKTLNTVYTMGNQCVFILFSIVKKYVHT